MKSTSFRVPPGVTSRGDKRYYARFSELSFSYEGKVEEVPIRPPDVSLQGMFIQTGRHFPEGAVLKVRFRLVRSRYEVHARAEVRYCLPGVGIGVEFVDISAEDRLAIENELRDAERDSSQDS
jgi:hypothetical protein